MTVCGDPLKSNVVAAVVAEVLPCPSVTIQKESGSVDVPSRTDTFHANNLSVVVDAVDDAVLGSSRGIETFELESEWLTDAVGVARQIAIDKFDDSSRHFRCCGSKLVHVA
jgi:hypothetical protein